MLGQNVVPACLIRFSCFSLRCYQKKKKIHRRSKVMKHQSLAHVTGMLRVYFPFFWGLPSEGGSDADALMPYYLSVSVYFVSAGSSANENEQQTFKRRNA